MEKHFGVISADGHCRLMHLPFDLWTKRLPRKLLENGPRVVEGPDGTRQWVVEGRVWSGVGWAGVGRGPVNCYTRAGLPEEPEPGVSRARNSGWGSASGAIVAYTDDDCYPARDFVDRILDGFERDEAQLHAPPLETPPGEQRRGEVAFVEDDVRARLHRQAGRDQAGCARGRGHERDVFRPRADEACEERAALLTVLLPVPPASSGAPALERLLHRGERRAGRQAVGGAVQVAAGGRAFVFRRREQWLPRPRGSRPTRDLRDPRRGPWRALRGARSSRSGSSGAPARRRRGPA